MRHHMQTVSRRLVAGLFPAWSGCHCSQSVWYTWVPFPFNYPLLSRREFRSPPPPQCTAGCWCCETSQPPGRCSVQHCAINHRCQMPSLPQFVQWMTETWAEPRKWSWSGLYLIAHDRCVFQAIWSRSNADRGKPYFNQSISISLAWPSQW